jgi:hypothetical protein
MVSKKGGTQKRQFSILNGYPIYPHARFAACLLQELDKQKDTFRSDYQKTCLFEGKIMHVLAFIMTSAAFNIRK